MLCRSCVASILPNTNYAHRNTVCVILCKPAGLIERKPQNYAHGVAMCVIPAPYELMSNTWSFCLRIVSTSLVSATSAPMACTTCRARRMMLEMDRAVPLVARKTV